MTNWFPIDENTPKDRNILVIDELFDEPYITKWSNDVYKESGGSGGPSGWFSGRHADHWGDHPLMDEPKMWCEVPRYKPLT